MEKRDDVILGMLLGFVEEKGFTFGLTLLVNGQFISGTAVSSAVHAKRLGEQFAGGLQNTGMKPDDSGPIAKQFLLLGGAKPVNEGYLHLVDVRTGSPPNPIIGHSLWRVRVDAIDAFQLGSWAAS